MNAKLSRTGGTAHIVQVMSMGGIETLVLDLVAASRQNDVCICLCGRVPELVKAWPALAAIADRVISVEKGPGVDLRAALRLTRLLRRIKPHTVVVHHIGPLLYGGISARLARVPNLVHVEHDAWHYDQPRHRRLLQVTSKLLQPHHVAVCEAVASRVRALLGSTPVLVVPPGIDTAKFLPGDKSSARRRLGLDDGLRWIGTVGRLVPVKNQVTLIKALALLDADVGLAIVGEGPERLALEQMAESLGLAARVRLLGQRDDVTEILPAFDVFCLPSLNEGLPRSIIEAQSCGVPVVASDVGGVRDVVCSRTGALVPPGDTQILAAELRRILDTAPDKAAIREHVVQRFSIAGVKAAIDSLSSRNQSGLHPADATEVQA